MSPSLTFRCVHTMSHGRMKHNTALPHDKNCLVYATKLITVPLKNNFLSLIFQFIETVERETHMHHIPHQKLRVHCSWWQISVQQTFDETDTLSIKFQAPRHSTICRSHAETAPHWHLHYSWHLPHGKVVLCCILPHGIVSTHLLATIRTICFCFPFFSLFSQRHIYTSLLLMTYQQNLSIVSIFCIKNATCNFSRVLIKSLQYFHFFPKKFLSKHPQTFLNVFTNYT